jgi:serine protease Do
MRLVRLSALLVATALATGLPRAARAYDGPPSFADEAQHLLPGVVNVSTSQTIRGEPGPTMPNIPGLQGSPFEQFFRDFMERTHPGLGTPDQGQGQGGGEGQSAPGGQNDQDNGDDDNTPNPNPQAPARHLQSLGSGFIIDPSGIIVTNNHVIDGADEITVTLQDNTILKAKLLGHDDRTDLAVLKVTPPPGKTLTSVSWGNSDSARVGDWVLAIGDPFGLGGTVTAGIVSSLGRDINQGPYDDFIQTDAPINRGNSGGPLFNMQGQVIGINTAIYSPSGGSIGIGFSIPSNLAKNVVAQLRDFGRAKRGWLGVKIQEVTPEIAESIGLPTASGAMVAGVNDGGPAQKSGLKPGDVILTFNDEPVKAMRNLPLIVAETPIGHDVPVQIWRNGGRQTVTVDVGEMPNDVEQAAAEAPAPVAPPATRSTELTGFGLEIAPITASTRARFQLPLNQKGVVITDVRTNTPASDRGLQPGNVIMEVQQQPVATVADVQQRLSDARTAHRKSVLLLVQTPDGMRFVPLPLG